MKSITVGWTEIANFADTRLVSIQFVELDDAYYLVALDGNFSLDAKLRKDGGADVVDFETNYKADGNKTFTDSAGHIIQTNSPFADAGGFRARFQGISGTATKNSTSNIDYKLTAERYINGVRLMIENHVDGDYVNFQIVDVDNILGYGAGTVLDEFGSKWYLDSTICTQPDVVVPYPAKILANLYIRIEYVSTGTVDDVKVKANLYLHDKTT